MSLPLRKFFQRLAIVTATLLVVSGLLLGAFQLVVTRVPHYRVQLQEFLQERTGLAVEFRELQARLRLSGPELVFNGLVVRTPDRQWVLATARRGSVGFDLRRSLSARQLISGKFTLEFPEIGLIRTPEGRIQLMGQSALPERDKPFAIEELPVGRFQVRNAVVSFRDAATGRGPWALSGVSFVLDRQRELFDLRGSASLPATLGKSLTFAARAHGNFAQPATLFSSFTVAGEQIDLAGWADMLPDEWPAPDSGHGAVRFSAAFHGTGLANLAATIELRNVTAAAPAWSTALPQADPLQIPDSVPAAVEHRQKQATASTAPVAAAVPAGELISYQHIALGLRAQRLAQGWEVSLSDIDISRAGSPWRGGQIQARWTRTEAGAYELAGRAQRIVLQNVWPLLAYLPESERNAQVRALAAEGTLTGLAFDFKRAGAADELRYTLRADVQGLALRAVRKIPGVRNFSGELQAHERGGELQLDSQQLQFDSPSMFRAPLTLRSLRGRLAWQREPDGWRVSSSDLALDSADGRAQVVMALQLPQDGTSSVIDLRARVQDLDASATSKYLPANKLTVKTLDWLDHAFTAGRVIDGDVTMKGPLRCFPFRKHEGEFIARAQVAGMTLNYQNGWAPATELTARVEFRNQGMSASAINATVQGLKVRNAQGEFPDFRSGEIAIRADAVGDLGQALSFLRASPVGPALGPLFQRLRGSGALASKVTLRLPLQRLADRRIGVVTQLTDATAMLEGIDAPLTSLSGSLTVQQTLLSNADLRGRWLGGAVAIDIVPENANSSKLNAQGHALAAQLAPFAASIVKLWGGTQWQAATRITTGGQAGLSAQTWQIHAAMDGLGVGMPYPLGKVEQGARPLHAELEFSDGLLARASYGEVRALLRMQRTGDRWTFERGGVRADGVAAALPAHRGLRVEGDVDRIVLDDWFALRATPGASGNSNGKFADFLQAANVRIGALNLYGYRWSDVRGVLQATDTGWRVDVAGPDVSGQVQIPQSFTGEEPLTASMERLLLQQQNTVAQAGARGDRDPRAWPNLRIHVTDLQLDEHRLGEIELKATRVANGLQIDSVDIAQVHAQGKANGQWLMTPDGERSSLALQITSSDVGTTLRALNYTPFMEARRGELRADLAWKGGFDGNFLGRASGSLSLSAEAGQLSSLQPGAGRVLGLFSVAALPRRLALDFSDLTEKGLGFDTVHGDFDMRDGNAYTSNLTLRGPAADIGIAGRTGLGTHDYDQTAVVTGNLGASLPVAGALAAGPAIGAALLLFSQVFKEPLKGITRGYYRITGSWDEPVVERVEAAAIKEAAISHAIAR